MNSSSYRLANADALVLEGKRQGGHDGNLKDFLDQSLIIAVLRDFISDLSSGLELADQV